MDRSMHINHRAPIILVNKAQCKRCGGVIESTHRHDFVWCQCRAIAVDGGRDYLKRVGDLDAVIELARYLDPDDSE